MRNDVRKLTVAMMALWPSVGIVLTFVEFGLAGVADIGAMGKPIGAWMLLAPLTPFVVRMANRFTFRPLIPSIVAHAGGTLALTAVHAAYLMSFVWVTGAPWRPLRMMSQCAVLLRFDSLIYAAIVFAVAALRSRRHAQRAALAPARLERRLAQMKWAALRESVHPTSLFATLDEIRVLIGRDLHAAEQRIQSFSGELRERLDAVRALASKPRVTPSRANGERRSFATLRMTPLIYPIFGAYQWIVFSTVSFIAGDPIRWRSTVAVSVLGGILSVIVIAVTKATIRWTPLRAATAIGAACIAHALIIEWLMQLLRPIAGGGPGAFLEPMIILSAIVAYVVRYDEMQRRANDSRRSAYALSRLVEEARVESLERAIAPHFLFNSLNSILSLLHIDPRAAVEMLGRLERLLRATLAGDSRRLVSLREELLIANEYIEIERLRFREALDVRVDVDEQLLDIRVPPLVLQPLVENAVRHGVLSRAGRGTICISACRGGTMLTLSVSNDVDADYDEWRDGIGLSAIRARLSHLFGANQSLAVIFDEGVTVNLRIPITEGLAA